jgi:ketosteroid isomerase-like protein
MAISKTGTKETNAVLDNHLATAQRGDLEGVLSDYSEDSVLFLPQGPVRGIAELREFFREFLAKPPSGFPKAFELIRRDVDGEVAYIVWKAEPGVRLATDTFLVRNGKILVQTFAASLAA